MPTELLETPEDLLPKDAAALERRRKKLEEDAAKIAAEEQQHQANIAEWNTLLLSRQELLNVIRGAQEREAKLREGLERRLEDLHFRALDSDTHPSLITQYHGAVAGAREALEFHPRWLERRTAELLALEDRLRAFVKKHQIEDRLPAELR